MSRTPEEEAEYNRQVVEYNAALRMTTDPLVEIKAALVRLEQNDSLLLAALNEIGARTGDTLAMVNTIDFAVRRPAKPKRKRTK